MNEDYGLSSYFSKCRCCLEDFQGNNSWKINKFIRTQFLEFTSVNVSFFLDTWEQAFNFSSSQLSESERLPQHICLNCNSVLARFTTIKKSFVENQLKLESFIELGPNPSDYVTVVKEENEEPKEDTDPYPFVESIEPFTDHWEYNANPIFQPESTFATSIFVNQYLNPPATKKTPKKPKPDPVVKAAATPAAKTEKKPRKYKERPNLICEFCSKQFKMHSTFKAHIDRHYNYNKFVCGKIPNSPRGKWLNIYFFRPMRQPVSFSSRSTQTSLYAPSEWPASYVPLWLRELRSRLSQQEIPLSSQKVIPS